MLPNIPPHFGMDQETKTDQIARAQQHIDDSRRLAFSLSECFRLMMINPDKDPEFCLGQLVQQREEAARTALERNVSRPLILVTIAPGKVLEPPEDDPEDDFEDEDDQEVLGFTLASTPEDEPTSEAPQRAGGNT